MRISLGTVSASALVLLAACGGATTTDTASPDAPPSSARPEATEKDETVEPEPDNCVSVGMDLARAIAGGEEEGVGMKANAVAAVKSPDFDKVYFIAVRFSATGVGDQVGVWASNSLKPGGGIIMAVDGFAQEFTVWPDADSTDAAISKADPSVDAATDCL